MLIINAEFDMFYALADASMTSRCLQEAEVPRR
jgi:hypothetical protein